MYDQVALAAGVSLILTLAIGPGAIHLLHRLRFGQYIREDGPASHISKAGTPTMGGLIFIVSLAVTTLLFAGRSINVMTALVVTVGYGVIGFVDDFIKIVLKRPLGLKARYKLSGEILLAVLLAVFSVYFLDRGTMVSIPFSNLEIDFGKIYYLFVVLVLVSATNAVNLTDGLDGLAAGVTLFVAVAYVFIALLFKQQDLAIFSAALLGGCLGFLVFNFHPARIFMGDTGSLALGAAIASLAVLSSTELLLLVIGGVYVLETLSVIAQVLSFRIRRKRLFLMSPIHHHFELAGWTETKIVLVFWTAGLLFAALGVFEACRLV